MAETLRARIQNLVDAIAPAILGKTPNSESVDTAAVQASWQVLTDAAAEEQLDFFQQLVAEDQVQLGKSSKVPGYFQMSLLMTAAFSGQTDVVQMLLAAGADPHYKQEQLFVEFDALSLAADKGHHKIVRLLAAAGADPNALNPLSRPLTIAVQKGPLATAQLLLELGADPNARGLLANNTLLIEATSKGQTDTARLLLNAEVDIHAENNFHETALDMACARGFVEIAQILIEAGAQINRYGRDQAPPLIVATAAPERLHFLQKQGLIDDAETLDDIGDRAAQIVQILLAAGADPNLKSGSGATALIIAAAQGSTAIVRALLAANADVNLAHDRDKVCHTPLITAIEKGQAAIVQLLLEVGADYLVPNGKGILPIDLANSKGLNNVVASLREQGADTDTLTATTTALIGAARTGDLEAVRQAIAAGAALDGDDRDFPKGGLTALMYAAQAGHSEILEVLIAAGADVNCHDARQLPWHKTALMYAAEGKQLEAVRLLLQAGAAPNASDRLSKPGRTALIYGAIEENTAIVQVLLSAGADVTLRDRTKNTALHYAYGNLEIVSMLLAAGADPYQVGEDDSPVELASLMGHSEIAQLMLKAAPVAPAQAEQAKVQSLDWAASNGDFQLAQTLIDQGVDVNAQSDDEDIPLHTAVIHGSLEVVKLLVNAGADPTIVNECGKNSLSLAIERGQTEIACWLRDFGVSLPESIDDCS